MQFSDIAGQEAIKQRLISSVLSNRVSHAQLFLGPEGSGSLALAVAYAQYISCENRQPADSCGECSSCRKYNRLIHPDLHFSYPFFRGGEKEDALPDLPEWRKILLENPYFNLNEWRARLDAQNKQPNINKAECLHILRNLSLKPFESEYKTIIIWLPEHLGNEGNRLLKALEEPAQKTLIILVATQQDQILNTIISRTQLVKIPALTDQDVAGFLIDKGTPRERAEQVAYLSEGNIQAALTFLKEEVDDHFTIFSGWLRNCYSDNGSQIIEFTEVAAKMGRENQKGFLKYGISLLRESLIILSGAPELVNLPEQEKTFITNFSRVMNMAKAESMIAELEKAHFHVERNANPKILFLDVSLQFVNILKYNTIPLGTQYIYK
jgi:DNA polymerase III subunit delta'